MIRLGTTENGIMSGLGANRPITTTKATITAIAVQRIVINCIMFTENFKVPSPNYPSVNLADNASGEIFYGQCSMKRLAAVERVRRLSLCSTGAGASFYVESMHSKERKRIPLNRILYIWASKGSGAGTESVSPILLITFPFSFCHPACEPSLVSLC